MDGSCSTCWPDSTPAAARATRCSSSSSTDRANRARISRSSRCTVVPLAEDQAMIDAIKACGGDARLTVYLYTGHDSWNQAYADPELYTWLLQQRRKAPSDRK